MEARERSGFGGVPLRVPVPAVSLGALRAALCASVRLAALRPALSAVWFSSGNTPPRPGSLCYGNEATGLSSAFF